MIVLKVLGLPRPGGSKKWIGGHRIIDASKHTSKWKQIVAAVGKVQCPAPIQGTLEVGFEFIMPRPKAHFKKDGTLKANAPYYHTVRPDATKLVRSTEDALTKIAWTDDSVIARQVVIKRYCDVGEPAGARITIRDLKYGSSLILGETPRNCCH